MIINVEQTNSKFLHDDELEGLSIHALGICSVSLADVFELRELFQLEPEDVHHYLHFFIKFCTVEMLRLGINKFDNKFFIVLFLTLLIRLVCFVNGTKTSLTNLPSDSVLNAQLAFDPWKAGINSDIILIDLVD
jgi:hypothetical protein